MLIADLVLRKRLSPRLVMVLVYGGGAVGLLVAYAAETLPLPQTTTDTTAGLLAWLLVPVLWIAHFARRTVEALAIHRFSHLHSPVELVAAAAYYVGFGIWIGQETGPAGPVLPALQVLLGVALFAIGEAGNAWHHLLLRRLRTGDGGHVIPRGGFFALVSCPHYLFELVAWAGFFVLRPDEATGAFLLASFVILLVRALNRHRAYRRAFDGREGRALYPPHRKALVPYVV